MTLGHLSKDDGERCAAESLDQSVMLRVEATHLVDDARAVLLGVTGDCCTCSGVSCEACSGVTAVGTAPPRVSWLRMALNAPAGSVRQRSKNGSAHATQQLVEHARPLVPDRLVRIVGPPSARTVESDRNGTSRTGPRGADPTIEHLAQLQLAAHGAHVAVMGDASAL